MSTTYESDRSYAIWSPEIYLNVGHACLSNETLSGTDSVSMTSVTLLIIEANYTYNRITLNFYSWAVFYDFFVILTSIAWNATYDKWKERLRNSMHNTTRIKVNNLQINHIDKKRSILCYNT